MDRLATDQFIAASVLKPRRFRSRCQTIAFRGPTARDDAELTEKNKWDIFADLLLSSPTSMGELVRQDPSEQETPWRW